MDAQHEKTICARGDRARSLFPKSTIAREVEEVRGAMKSARAAVVLRIISGT